MGRTLLAIVAAWITGMAIIMIVEMIGSAFNPQPPSNFMTMTAEETAAYVKTIPTSAYITVAFGYLLGSFAAGWMVTKVSKAWNSLLLPAIVGGLFTIGGIANFCYILPGQPTWFIVLCLLIFIPAAMLGHKAAR
ncbi:MAG: hypothetical protein WBD22_01830 [Pyrinomonadaceae bacterium]